MDNGQHINDSYRPSPIYIDDENFMKTLRFDKMGIQSTRTSYCDSLEYKCRSRERYGIYTFCQPPVLG
jgi:hypothetical protein